MDSKPLSDEEIAHWEENRRRWFHVGSPTNHDVYRLFATIDRDREMIAELADIVADYEQSAQRALGDSGCPDERHCTCVPPLRSRIRALEAELAETKEALSAMDTISAQNAHADWEECRQALAAARANPVPDPEC